MSVVKAGGEGHSLIAPAMTRTTMPMLSAKVTIATKSAKVTIAMQSAAAALLLPMVIGRPFVGITPLPLLWIGW